METTLENSQACFRKRISFQEWLFVVGHLSKTTVKQSHNINNSAIDIQKIFAVNGQKILKILKCPEESEYQRQK